jgi:beta-D-xylosidase 4
MKSSTEEYTDLSPFAQVVARVTSTGGLAGLSSDYVGLLLSPQKILDQHLTPTSLWLLMAVSTTLPSEIPRTWRCPFPWVLWQRADANGNLVLYPGTYTLTFDFDSKLSFNFALSGKATVIESFPQNPPNVTPFEYLGCCSDISGTTSSVLSGTSFKLSSNEPQFCVEKCADAGWHYAGVKDGQ